ncbi:type IV pilus modification PilV family protein [Rubinisphaera margarita]|uniref:type IV pilus modification PilV family protein n=1 Tax=Rubinisphaera margarita TaxID=2909586 RepID=UPI001EE814ED|nr:hypothetical protein [Rubinisphaera margarita]MCG6154852.1 hypothetical protein [Rubinisphaera margarita]
MKNRTFNRAGLSLLEVVISLSLLGAASAALVQLLESARVASVQTVRETEAIIFCESIIGEIVSSGIAPVEISEETIGEDPAWVYSVEVQETDWPTLVQSTVRVFHRNFNDHIDADVSLTRWIYIPATEEGL